MIKLKQLLPEISLMSGNAGSDDMEDFYRNASSKILPKKYDVVDDWIGFQYGGMKRRELDPEGKKKLDKAQALMLVNSEFKGIVNSKISLIAKRGGYELRSMSGGGDLQFYLVDPNAKYIYEYFIGIIKVSKGANTYRFTAKKAFGLKTYQIHWSNIAKEHMGKGLGKLIYTMVYEYITGQGAALVSDSMLFQGSQKMWIDYIPSIASYFGIVMDDVFFPIDKGEIKSNGRHLMGDGSVSSMVAMENPPPLIRKIGYNFKGLSFANGEYGTVKVSGGVNDKLMPEGETIRTFTFNDKSNNWDVKKNKNAQFTYFSNLVDESNSMLSLFKKFEKLGGPELDEVTSFGSKMNLKAVVFAFNNANVIVKSSAGKLVMVAI
jgi:hypothetical protein